MQSFSENLASRNPLMLFKFKKDDVVIEYDLKKPYGVKDDESFIYNEVSNDYLKPRLARIANNKGEYPLQNLTNQITLSEIDNENDSSILIGRNTSVYNGNTLYFTRPKNSYNEKFEWGFDKNFVYYWQILLGAGTAQTQQQFVDYDEHDDYIVVMQDHGSVNDSYSIINTFGGTGTTETYEGAVKPKVLDGGWNGSDDFRDISIKLINPRTAEIYDAYTFEFVRKGSLVVGSNIDEYTPETFSLHNIYQQSPNNESGKYNDENKPRIKDILTNYMGREYKLRKEGAAEGSKPPLPELDSIKVVVENRVAPNRSINTKNTTNVAPQLVMRFLHYNVYFKHSNRTLEFRRIDNGITAFSHAVLQDKAILIAVACTYRMGSLHNPDNNVYDYTMDYRWIIDDTYYENDNNTFRVTTSKKDFKDRGYGDTITQGLPTFLNMPITFGFHPTTSKDLVARYNVKLANNTYVDMNYIQTRNFNAIDDHVVIDNFAMFNDLELFEAYYDLYYATFLQEDLLIDKTMSSYWGCDTLRLDMQGTPNKIANAGNAGNFNTYADLMFRGQGKVTQTPVTHRVIKNCINFDGNSSANTNMFYTWDNNASYFINFWIKTDQKTKGTIMTDFGHNVYDPRGIYIGVADGGFLEVAVNSFTTRILLDTNIADDRWHMISIGVYREILTTVTNYVVLVYVDGIVKTRFELANKYTFNKDYSKDYQVYFMGHPRANNVKGSLSRIGFYKMTPTQRILNLLYSGDIEHMVTGTILLRNMPHSTNVRIYNNRTGEFIDELISSSEDGSFVYRNYKAYDVYVMVMDNRFKYGTFQVVGPVEPKA